MGQRMGDIERLVDGFQRFQHQYYEATPSLYRNLRDGQHPSTLLVGCCDSRVDPCLLYTSPSPRDQRGSRMPSSA